jgi:PAS domain S-box-containing protein
LKQELNKARSPRSTAREMARLRARLAEAEATLDAIRNGEVDAVVVAGSGGSRVFTLEGEEHAYRMLIESMNEGALAMSAGMLILFANSCFSGMVREPLSLVIGTPFSRFLSEADQKALIEVLRDSRKEGTKTQVTIHAGDGSLMEAQISVRPLSGNAEGERSIGVIVTDMTDARRSEMLLRALTKRVVIARRRNAAAWPSSSMTTSPSFSARPRSGARCSWTGSRAPTGPRGARRPGSVP